MKLRSKKRTNPPLLMLFGPTGVGKSDLLFKLFKSYFNNKIEIISADSMQVYRGMDIGSAKPSSVELSAISHHLIDILSPNVQFHAGEFVDRVDSLVPQIFERGNLPVISGGTGYYFRNYLFGLPEVPPSNLVLAKEISAKLDSSLEARERLFSKLKGVDSVAGNRIHFNDTYRIARALEVYETTGKPLSSFEISTKLRSHIDVRVMGLARDRDELYDRINCRVDSMVSAGLFSEVASLMEAGYSAGDPGMKGIGYREFFEARDLGRGDDLEWIVSRIRQNSRHYAKKQVTYFKQIPDVSWFHPDDGDGIIGFLERHFSVF